MNLGTVLGQRNGKRYAKRQSMAEWYGADDREAKRAKGTAKVIETPQRLQRNKARRASLLQPHKMNMRLNIDYTHKNNVRTKICYIQTIMYAQYTYI